MLIVKLLLAAYLACALMTFLMVKAAIDNNHVRRLFFLIGLVMPFIFLYAAVVSFVRPRKVMPFNEELGNAEEQIETERIRLFGGERTCPSFSDHWKRAYEAYLDKLVQQATKTSEKIAAYSFGPLAAGRIR